MPKRRRDGTSSLKSRLPTHDDGARRDKGGRLPRGSTVDRSGDVKLSTTTDAASVHAKFLRFWATSDIANADARKDAMLAITAAYPVQTRRNNSIVEDFPDAAVEKMRQLRDLTGIRGPAALDARVDEVLLSLARNSSSKNKTRPLVLTDNSFTHGGLAREIDQVFVPACLSFLRDWAKAWLRFT